LTERTTLVAGSMSLCAIIGIECGAVGWLRSLDEVSHIVVVCEGAREGYLAIATHQIARGIKRHLSVFAKDIQRSQGNHKEFTA